MERWQAFKRWLHDLVLARDVAEAADDVLGPADTASGGARSLFGRAFDALLYGGWAVLAFVTEQVQVFAPLSYLACFLLAVILVPPAARVLSGTFSRLALSKPGRSAPAGSGALARNARTLADLPPAERTALAASSTEREREIAALRSDMR